MRRNFFWNRRVVLELILIIDVVVLVGFKDREYIEENFNIFIDSDMFIQGIIILKENRRGSIFLNEDLFFSLGLLVFIEDIRENGVQFLVDFDYFIIRLVWKLDVDEENCEEQFGGEVVGINWGLDVIFFGVFCGSW